MNSPSPRTDAEQEDARNVALEFTCRNPPPNEGENVMVVPAEFARGLERELNALKSAVAAHHGQKADDRCIEDDDRLYAAAGLPPCDRRVGSKEDMLRNCARFIDRRCEPGGWKSYLELERELSDANHQKITLTKAINDGQPDACVDSGEFTFNDWMEIRSRLLSEIESLKRGKLYAPGFGPQEG